MKRKHFISRVVTYLVVAATVLMSIPMTAVAAEAKSAVSALTELVVDEDEPTVVQGSDEDFAEDYTPANGKIDLTSAYVDADDTKITIGNTDYTLTQNEADEIFYLNAPTDSISKGLKVSINLAFSGGENHIKLTPGQEIWLQIDPALLTIDKNTTTPITEGNSTIGTTYISTTGRIRFVLDETYLTKHAGTDGKTEIYESHINIQGSFGSEIGNDPDDTDSAILKLGDISIHIPFDYADHKSRVEVTKTADFDQLAKEIQYTLTATNVGNEPSSDAKVYDSITSNSIYLQEYEDIGSLFEKISGEGSITSTEQNMIWDIGDIAAGATKTLVYKVKLKDSYFSQTSAPNIANEAYATWGYSGKSATVSVSKSFSTSLNITKKINTKTVDSDGDSIIEYEVSVEAPKNNSASIPDVKVVDQIEKSDGYYPFTSYKSFTVTSKDSSGNVTTIEKPIITEDVANGKFTWKIGSMAPGTTMTVKYRIVLGGNAWSWNNLSGQDVNMENTATVYSGDTKFGQAHYKEKVGTKRWAEKSGTMSDDGSKVDYTVTANPSNGTIGVLNQVEYIRDELIGTYEFVGDATLTAYDKTGALVFEKTFDITKNSEKGTVTVEYKKNGDKTQYTHTVQDLRILTIDIANDETKDNWDIPYGTYTYRLTYTVRNTVTANGYIYNKAIVGTGIEGTSPTKYFDHTVGVAASSSFGFSLNKNYVKYSYDAISWRATIIANRILAGSVAKDFDSMDSESWQNSKRQYYTKEQLDAVKITDKDGNDINKSYYEIEGIENPYHAGIYYGFYVKFIKEFSDFGGRIYIDYDSTIDTTWLQKSGQSGTYYNKIVYNTNGFDDESVKYFDINGYDRITKDKGDLDWSNNTYTWKITLNHGSAMSGNATLTEYIPKGMEFESAEITETGSDYAKQTYLGTPLEISLDDSELIADEKENVSQVIQIPIYDLYKTETLTNNDDFETEGQIVVTIKTKIVDDELLYGKSNTGGGDNSNDGVASSSVTKTFVNRATFEQDSTNYKVTATASDTISNKPMTKGASTTNQPDVPYTLDINENAADLIAGSNDLVVVDEMKGLILSEDEEHELAVYKVESDGTKTPLTKKVNGEDEDGDYTLELTYDSSKVTGFKLTVPDQTHIVVEYYANPDGVAEDTISISNTAYYGQYKNSPAVKTECTEYKIYDASSSSSASAIFNIKKVDEQGNAIPGVSFKLQRVAMDENGDPIINDDGTPEIDPKFAGVTKKTDEDGYVTFDSSVLMNGVNAQTTKKYVYVFEETSAPKGYQVDSTPHYVQFTRHKDAEPALEENGILHSIVSGRTITIMNTYQVVSAEIPVEKVVEGKLDCAEQFSFTIKEVEEAKYGEEKACYTDDTLETPFKGETVNITGNGYATFAPIYFHAEGKYLFEVYENALSDSQIEKGYTHDDTVYFVEVFVKYESETRELKVTHIERYEEDENGNDTTRVAVTEDNRVTFHNAFNQTAELSIPIEKTVTNINDEDAAGKTFTFALYQTGSDHKVTEDSTEISKKTVTLDDFGEGMGDFELIYTTELEDGTTNGIEAGMGTYYYVMREIGEYEGFEENNTEHYLTVIVKPGASSVDPELDVDVILDGDEEESVDYLVINAELDGVKDPLLYDEESKNEVALKKAAAWVNNFKEVETTTTTAETTVATSTTTTTTTTTGSTEETEEDTSSATSEETTATDLSTETESTTSPVSSETEITSKTVHTTSHTTAISKNTTTKTSITELTEKTSAGATTPETVTTEETTQTTAGVTTPEIVTTEETTQTTAGVTTPEIVTTEEITQTTAGVTTPESVNTTSKPSTETTSKTTAGFTTAPTGVTTKGTSSSASSVTTTSVVTPESTTSHSTKPTTSGETQSDVTTTTTTTTTTTDDTTPQTDPSTETSPTTIETEPDTTTTTTTEDTTITAPTTEETVTGQETTSETTDTETTSSEITSETVTSSETETETETTTATTESITSIPTETTEEETTVTSYPVVTLDDPNQSETTTTPDEITTTTTTTTTTDTTETTSEDETTTTTTTTNPATTTIITTTRRTSGRTTATSTTKSSPKTGENRALVCVVLIAIAAASIGGVTISNRKRTKR